MVVQNQQGMHNPLFIELYIFVLQQVPGHNQASELQAWWTSKPPTARQSRTRSCKGIPYPRSRPRRAHPPQVRDDVLRSNYRQIHGYDDPRGTLPGGDGVVPCHGHTLVLDPGQHDDPAVYARQNLRGTTFDAIFRPPAIAWPCEVYFVDIFKAGVGKVVLVL